MEMQVERPPQCGQPSVVRLEPIEPRRPGLLDEEGMSLAPDALVLPEDGGERGIRSPLVQQV
ncbi:hypothetical protein ACN28I_27190 [Archangium gephyra]|uniref:hypothetical protein n=1 Tax=Archangium gephyra TaxID=48 RepID=UPI003B7E0100